jgi:hypothetical protein
LRDLGIEGIIILKVILVCTTVIWFKIGLSGGLLVIL